VAIASALSQSAGLSKFTDWLSGMTNARQSLPYKLPRWITSRRMAYTVPSRE